jgi:ATPase family associated with various cellular activities (AAA)
MTLKDRGESITRMVQTTFAPNPTMAAAHHGFMGGVNIADMIKTQYLFKYLGEVSSSVGAMGPLFTLFVIMMYDSVAKAFPKILERGLDYAWILFAALYAKFTTTATDSSDNPNSTNANATNTTKSAMSNIALPASEFLADKPLAPPPGDARAFIMFHRGGDAAAPMPQGGGKSAQKDSGITNSDLYIEAIITHVAGLTDVRSLEFNGSEFLPNFGDPICIENDIWFQLVTLNGRTPKTMAPETAAKKTGKMLTDLFEMQATAGATNTVFGVDKQAGALPQITFRLSSYANGIKHIHRFVEEIYVRYQQEKQNKLGSNVYYFDMITTGKDGSYRPSLTPTHCIYTKSRFYTNRTLRNVYFHEARALERRINFFMNRRDWYDRKGIPWTLGVTIWGTPGCGKTSTIKAIANMTGRHIFNISLPEVKTREMLKDLFYNDEVRVTSNGKTDILHIPIAQRLYVIEDIDAMSSVVLRRDGAEVKAAEEEKKAAEHEELQRQMKEVQRSQQTGGTLTLDTMFEFQAKKKEAEKQEDALDLATFLNVLDGIRETPGRAIILSTNHPRRIDPAILRPGRCGDMILQFRKHDRSMIREMIEGFYDAEMPTDLVAMFEGAADLDEKWTPAEVSQVLFMNMGDMLGAVRALIHEDPRRLFGFLDEEEREEKEREKAREAEMEAMMKGMIVQEDHTPCPTLIIEEVKTCEEVPEINEEATEFREVEVPTAEMPAAEMPAAEVPVVEVEEHKDNDKVVHLDANDSDDIGPVKEEELGYNTLIAKLQSTLKPDIQMTTTIDDVINSPMFKNFLGNSDNNENDDINDRYVKF